MDNYEILNEISNSEDAFRDISHHTSSRQFHDAVNLILKQLVVLKRLVRKEQIVEEIESIKKVKKWLCSLYATCDERQLILDLLDEKLKCLRKKEATNATD